MHYGFASQKGKLKTVGLERLRRMARDPGGAVRFLTEQKILFESK